MFRNEHKKVLCPEVLKTIANSLDQGKTHQLPEVTILVGASHRRAGLLKFSREIQKTRQH